LDKIDQLESAVKNIHHDLILACRENDRNAQFQIYKLYYKAMYNTAIRIVNSTAEAEDIMQESFLDAFRKIDSYREESSFGKWLKRIVINKSLDSIKKAREMTSIDDTGMDIPEEEEENYLEMLSYKIEEIRKAIHLLPDSYRIVLTLHLLEGYDHEEIALVLQISNNLSRIRYFRARQKLVDYIRRSGKNQSSMNIN
jgi:RNA polymerase sigma factor (sigma-70 family)